MRKIGALQLVTCNPLEIAWEMKRAWSHNFLCSPDCLCYFEWVAMQLNPNEGPKTLMIWSSQYMRKIWVGLTHHKRGELARPRKKIGYVSLLLLDTVSFSCTNYLTLCSLFILFCVSPIWFLVFRESITFICLSLSHLSGSNPGYSAIFLLK